MLRFESKNGIMTSDNDGNWVDWYEVRNALQEVLSCPCDNCRSRVEAVVHFQFFKEQDASKSQK